MESRSLGAAQSLPRPVSLARLALPRLRLGPAAGGVALVSLVAGVFVLVLFTASGPSFVVARSTRAFPSWEAGPLHGLFGAVPLRFDVLTAALSLLVCAMTLAYFVSLATARSLSLRALVATILVLHVILLLGPPMLSSDLFNYMGYARLGGLHGLNPYTHVIARELHDPVYTFTTWRHLHSPYGPLFSAATFLLAGASLSATYWTLKVVTVVASLGLLALLWLCARQLGRDPRIPLAFVALNPVYIVFAVGGFHNDFFMLAPAMAAVTLLLAGRDRAAGAALVAAVAVKFNAALLLPFLLLGAGEWARRRRLLEGVALCAAALLALSVVLFGPVMPNLSDQTTLLTGFSIPNLFGLLIGAGGATTAVLWLFTGALVAALIWLLWRPGDWLSRAGWAMLALILSLGWLMPWYVIWAAPLAALGRSSRLRRAVLALTVFLVLTAVPETPRLLQQHRVDLLGGPAGRHSRALQHSLAQ